MKLKGQGLQTLQGGAPLCLDPSAQAGLGSSPPSRKLLGQTFRIWALEVTQTGAGRGAAGHRSPFHLVCIPLAQP